jgi:transcription elongation GreA/GreB family factor
VEADVLIAAMGDGRTVWSCRCAFCGTSPGPASDRIHNEFLSDERLGGEAQVGSRVRVRDAEGEEDEYTIVRKGEADPAQGRISTESPVGRALLGGRGGDEVTVQTPGGIRALTIVEVAAPRCCSLEE